MALFGEFTAHCANCGVSVLTNCSGKDMWRSSKRWMVCGKECHDQMDIKHTRSIIGKDSTLADGLNIEDEVIDTW